MATYNVVEFPGRGTTTPVTLEGNSAKLRDILRQAQITYDPEGKHELRVGEVLTRDLDQDVPDGATVSLTARIKGG